MKPVSSAYGVTDMGPTSYAVNLGTGTTNGGAPYGSPWNSDGMFRAKVGTRIADVPDGTSNTAMMSESVLGSGPENYTGAIPDGRPPGYSGGREAWQAGFPRLSSQRRVI